MHVPQQPDASYLLLKFEQDFLFVINNECFYIKMKSD